MFLKRISYVIFYAFIAAPVWAEESVFAEATSTYKVDASLREFVRQVWDNSPAIMSALAAVDEAKARADGASKPLYNPALELDAERAGINTTSIGLSQTIDWSNKKAAFTRLSAREIDMANAHAMVVRQGVASEAIGALVRYSSTKEMQALAKRRSQLMKEFFETVEQRQAAGDIAPLDVMLSQVAYSEALMQQAAQASNLAEAKAKLQAVSGFEKLTWPSLPSVLLLPPRQVDDSIIAFLPELYVQKMRVAVAQAQIKLAEKDGTIDPTIGFRAGREDSDVLLGLSIEIPLFVRNDFSANAIAASHAAIVEERSYQEAYRRALARLHGALGRFQNTTRAWNDWKKTGQESLYQQMGLLEDMWRQGALSSTDFLIQAKQNIDTQAAATALKGELWQSANTWLTVSGQIEQWLGLVEPAAQMNIGE